MVGITELQKLFNGNGFIEWLIVSTISSFLLALFNILIFKKLFRVQSTRKKDAIIIVIDAIIRVISSIIIAAPFYRIFNIITSIFILKICYKQKIEKCILGESINAITIICTEAFFSKVFCNLLNHVDTYFNGMYDYKYKACLGIAITLIRGILYIIITKKNITINIPDNMRKRNRYEIITLSIVGSMLLFFNALEMSIFEMNFPLSILIMDIISLMVCFYFSMKNIIKIAKIEEQNIKIETLESYNKTLSIMYDNIRGFRHDFGNIVQALNGYVESNNQDGIKRMSDSLMKEFKSINNMGLLDPNIIKNPAIYSILTNKYYLAEQDDIEINIQVMMDFAQVEKYTYELCRILGILLDNAIEAARECEEKIINVKFIRDYRANRNLIIIENSYNEVDIDIDKIFEKGYTSKADCKNEHGLGLWNVRKILKKMNNFNLFTTKEELFCQQLEIYNI